MAYKETNPATNISWDNSTAGISGSPSEIQTALENLKTDVAADISALDAQGSVLDKDLTAPPGSPPTGARYIVGASATGAWATHDEKIAEWSGSAWIFTTPTEGFLCEVEDEDTYYAYSSSHPAGAWNKLATYLSHADLADLGSDDHTQYSLADGTRAFTGTVSGVTPTSAPNLATKGYVDTTLVTVIPTVKKTAAYTITSADRFIAADPVAVASFTLTMEVAPADGRIITVKDSSGGATAANKVTIAGNGKLIDGAASIEIKSNYTALTFIFDSTEDEWFLV